MERFTRMAEESIYSAHSITLNHMQQKMEAEHLLLALLNQHEGILSQALDFLEIDRDVPISVAEDRLQALPKITSPNDKVHLSSDCEQCVERAEQEADRMTDEYVGSEHLMLGILSGAKLDLTEALGEYGISTKTLLPVIYDLRKGKRITNRHDDGQEPEIIKEFCSDFIKLAKANKFDPVIGRDEEVRRVIQVLARRTKNNPVLIGEPGVGKTAIIEGLAQRIYHGDVPEILKGSRLVGLDLAAMVAGTKFRGEFEERLKRLLNEIENSKDNIILFIDELHTLIGAGSTDGSLDASNMLKPALARGMLRCVGATTVKEYKQHIEKDAALARRFQQIYIAEPSVEDCVGILRGLKGRYEVHHGVRIKDSAIIASAQLAHRYIPDRFLPDKAIDLLDEAASKIRIEIDSMPTIVDQKERRIMQLEIEQKALTKEDDPEALLHLENQKKELLQLQKEREKLIRQWKEERKAIQNIRNLKEKIESAKQREMDAQREGNLELAAKLKYGTLDHFQRELDSANELLSGSKGERLLKEEIDEEDIANIVSKWTGVPVSKMMREEQDKLLVMEDELSNSIVGQRHAIRAVANSIRRSRAGIQDPNRPMGSFIFMGSTGTGKTELAKSLAKFLFDDSKAIIRLDMSEYMEKHTVSRLLGAPPGYAGFEEGGILTDAVRAKPYSVVLFDEVEKGHPEVFNILLQVLDEGVLTDSRGIKVNFKNTIVILTTNLGGELILKLHEEEKQFTEEVSRKILLTKFRPELLNRVDDIIIFEPFSMNSMERLVRIQMDRLVERLKENGVHITIDKSVDQYLATKGFDLQFGARPLKRVIQRELEDVLAYKILDETIKPGHYIEIRLLGEELSFHRIRSPLEMLRKDFSVKN